MTYLLMSIPFMVVAIIAFLLKRKNGTWKITVVTLLATLILFVLTIIFDNIMVWADFFGYSDAQHLGIWIGLIPIEDLFYPLFSALLIPAIWLPGSLFRKNKPDAASNGSTVQATTERVEEP